MKISTLALPLLALTAAPAMAQDQYATTTGDHSWSGVYVGGTFGLGAQSNDRGDTVVFDTDRNGTFGDTVRTTAGVNAFSPGFCNGASQAIVPATANCRGDRDGYEYSVRVGADQQSGNLVYGVVIDAQRSESRDAVTAFSTTPAAYTLERQLDLGIGARGRIGIAPGNGQGLFYVTGGANYGRIDHEFRTSNTANAFTALNDDKWQWGYSAGAGAEVKLARNLSWGIEYLFTRYEDDDYSVGVTAGSAPATNPFLLNGGGTNLRPGQTDFDQHNLRTTLSFRF